MAENPENPSPSAVENPSENVPASPAQVAENNLSAEIQAEKPSENLSENDDSSKAAAGKVGLAKRIRKRIAGVFGKAGFDKGRGRPKRCRDCNGEGCGECNFTGVVPGKSDLPISRGEDGGGGGGETESDVAGGEKTTAGAASPVVDTDGRAILDASLGAGVEVALDGGDMVALFFAERAGHDADFAEKTVSRYRPKGEKIDRFVAALKLALKEQNVEVKNPGTKAAILSGLGLAAPYLLMIREFRAEARRREQVREKGGK